MFMNEMFDRFSEKCPIPVATRVLIERVLSPDKLDHWFDSQPRRHGTRELLFSTIYELMDSVVVKVFPSIHCAYQSKAASISCSITSVYHKLNSFSPLRASTLVHDTAIELTDIVNGLGALRTPLLPGYQVTMLDGNGIAKTEHRLEVLGYTTAAPLPGKSLVIYDPGLDLATHLFPCEDGHTQERALLEGVLATVQANDLIVADRNFCIQRFLSGINDSEGFYNIRKHQNLPIEILEELTYVGETDTGTVYEQKIRVSDVDGENKHDARLITLELKNETRDGDDSLMIVTNLPVKVDAIKIAAIYRERGSIETLFLKLTSDLNSEINALGYPRAALRGFALALTADNTLSVLKAAMRSVYAEDKIENEVSAYYIAGEIARTREAMRVALPEEEWSIFQEMPLSQFVGFLKRLITNIDLEKYKKHTRGKKKPLPKRNKYPGTPHVSTFRLLIAAKGKVTC